MSLKRKKMHEIKLYINENLIQQKKEIRYLGVIIDDELNWKPRINNVSVCAKISKESFASIKLRNYVDLTTIKSILQLNVLSFAILRISMGTYFTKCNNTFRT